MLSLTTSLLRYLQDDKWYNYFQNKKWFLKSLSTVSIISPSDNAWPDANRTPDISHVLSFAFTYSPAPATTQHAFMITNRFTNTNNLKTNRYTRANVSSITTVAAILTNPRTKTNHNEQVLTIFAFTYVNRTTFLGSLRNAPW